MCSSRVATFFEAVRQSLFRSTSLQLEAFVQDASSRALRALGDSPRLGRGNLAMLIATIAFSTIGSEG